MYVYIDDPTCDIRPSWGVLASRRCSLVVQWMGHYSSPATEPGGFNPE